MPSIPKRKELPEPIASLRRERRWPKGVPMPKAGPYRGGEPWSIEDETLLCRFYPQYGSMYSARLLGRSRTAVKGKAARLKISAPTGRTWTKAEDRYLRRFHHRRTASQLAERLDRTANAVQERLGKLGLTTPNAAEWSRAEITFLRKHYRTMSYAEIARHLGRTPDAVNLRIGKARLPTKNRTRFVPSARDLSFIRNNLGRLSFVEMGKRLNAGEDAIRTIALGLGFRARPTTRPWTEKDDTMLRRFYGKMPRALLAEKMNRTPQALGIRAAKIGATKEAGKPWSRRDDATLRRLHRAGMGYRAMAQELGRTLEAVHGRVRTLRLVETQPIRPRWAERDEALLRTLYRTLTVEEIATRLNRTVVSIRKKALVLGIAVGRV